MTKFVEIQECRPNEELLGSLLEEKNNPLQRTWVCEAIREYIASVSDLSEVVNFYNGDEVIALEISKMLVRRLSASPVEIPSSLLERVREFSVGKDSALKLNSLLVLDLLGEEVHCSDKFRRFIERKKRLLKDS